MKFQNGTPLYSPSDLIRFSESPFSSWMDRCYLEDRDSLTPDEDDPLLTVLARRGIEHESRYLESLRQQGMDVCEIDSEDPQAFQRTLDAIRAGREVIFQARLEGDGFGGFADFLIRSKVPGGQVEYEVWDTKLAKSPKTYFIIQLCCYADMLESMTGSRPVTLGVVLGDGEQHRFRTSDFYHYYRRVRQAFIGLINKWPDGGPPIPDSSADHGRWGSHATQWLLDRDHLSQVANISRGQIAKLEKAGVNTMSQLAVSHLERLKGIGNEVLGRLKKQAALQVKSAQLDSPLYEILPPPEDNPSLGLASLPPASSLDVFFDMEGYPAADDWLEYLFGVTFVEEGRMEFVDWWAHDAVQEKQAFEGFVDWVYDRWRRDPAMHIYHYAAYETVAMKNLMGKFGTRESEIDTLLRAGVFVDLYDVVRRGLMVGEPSYSIKNLEHLYMEGRAGDVTDAAASVVYYDAWCESGEPEDWRESPLLESIREYNKDDCDSTLLLTRWLRERQQEAGIDYVKEAPEPQECVDQSRLKPDALERKQLADALLGSIPIAELAGGALSGENRIAAMLAWLLEFHRRADKPMWWRYFDRLEMSAEDLWDDMDCLSGLLASGESREVKASIEFDYGFDPDQDTKLSEGVQVGLVPDTGMTASISRFDPEGRLSLRVSKRKLALADLATLPASCSIVPFEYINPGSIPNSIFQVASRYSNEGVLASCVRDFLERNPPRLEPKYAGPLAQPGEDSVKAGVRVVGAMQDTCLCIQGPPGTGKTYTAARIIRALIEQGKAVGITSNSHKAINNLMEATCDAGLVGVVVKVGGSDEDPLFERFPWVEHTTKSAEAADTYGGGLIGGTAWLFSRDEIAEKLDYLFVDEAGQVSIANLVGMSRSTRNIVLMGDQMQLGQPIEGTHPGESGQSILEYYLEGHATIPEGLGLFLGESWRMHPDVCSFISDAVYESRLNPEAHTVNRVVRLPADVGNLVNREAGILFVPVEHEGNTQGSDEEVAVICQVVDELLGRTLTDREGKVSGEITITDGIIFVAPYNMQVRKLKRALPAGARVASVDKFQGQEAPVVVISMCASPGEFGSRGMQFVLDKNRLNVAISRAQSLAIVVGDPRLVEAPARSIDDMKRLNLYSWLVENG